MCTTGGQVIIMRTPLIPQSTAFCISQAWVQNTNLVVVFPSTFGSSYAVESRADLTTNGHWTTVLNGVIGTGDPVTNKLQRDPHEGFVRIRKQP